MDISSTKRLIIISVFAIYTAALLIYSIVTRKSMKKEIIFRNFTQVAEVVE